MPVLQHPDPSADSIQEVQLSCLLLQPLCTVSSDSCMQEQVQRWKIGCDGPLNML